METVSKTFSTLVAFQVQVGSVFWRKGWGAGGVLARQWLKQGELGSENPPCQVMTLSAPGLRWTAQRTGGQVGKEKESKRYFRG